MSCNHFGRIVAPPDGRDHHYLMRTVAPQVKAALPPKPRKQPYRDGPVLDQGPYPYCVGFSARGFLESAPIMSKPSTGPSGKDIYLLAQTLDEWAGQDYEGSSVRGGMKALAQLGQIKSYAWGQTVDEMIAWIMGGYGTVVIGSNWYIEMSEVDDKGFMREPASNLSSPVGGHAWRTTYFFSALDAFLMRQAWGVWGMKDKQGRQAGYAYVRRRLMERLLREDGEIAAPLQVKVKATPIV